MSQPESPHTDWGFRIILGMAVAVALWLLATPIFPTVARCSLERFHLTTQSFAIWAIQQPVPAMYNFYNRCEVTPSPFRPRSANVVDRETLNHFPLRLLTFGDNRPYFLNGSGDRQVDLYSSYRGQTLHTRYRLIAEPHETAGSRSYRLQTEAVP